MSIKRRKQDLTQFEQEIWGAILRFYEENEVMPLRSELAKVLSYKGRIVSPQLVQYWLSSMCAKGWIELSHLKKRGIKLK